MRVAIFDFDGTVYKGETFQIMMDHLKNHRKYHKRYNRFFRAVIPRYIGSKLKLYPEQRMRERSMQLYIEALEDLSIKELNTYFKEIAVEFRKDFNQNVVRRLKEHIENGDHVMLVSGAYTPLLQFATNEFDFHKIIGTDIPVNGQAIDRSTPLYHIQGPRKNDAIKTSLKKKEIDWDNSFAYADSYSDIPVLELVGNPVAVQPEDRLRTIAETRGWEVI